MAVIAERLAADRPLTAAMGRGAGQPPEARERPPRAAGHDACLDAPLADNKVLGTRCPHDCRLPNNGRAARGAGVWIFLTHPEDGSWARPAQAPVPERFVYVADAPP